MQKILERELARRVPGNPDLGDRGKIARRTRIVRRFLDGVEAGDPRLTKLFLDRLWPPEQAKEAAKGPVIVVLDKQDMEEEVRDRTP